MIKIIDILDDDLDKIYNDKKNRIDEIFNYYLSMHDYIEELEYIKEDYLEMLINISKAYTSLNISKKHLEEWHLSNNKKYRELSLINNSDNNNYIDLSKYKMTTSDLINKYKESYNYKAIINLFNLVEKDLFDYEIKYFFSMITMIEEIPFTSNSSNNLRIISNLINYIDNVYNFVLEKDKEYQKRDEEILEEENNNMKLSSNE